MGKLPEYTYKMTGVGIVVFISQVGKPGELPLVKLPECAIELADLTEHFWGCPFIRHFLCIKPKKSLHYRRMKKISDDDQVPGSIELHRYDHLPMAGGGKRNYVCMGEPLPAGPAI